MKDIPHKTDCYESDTDEEYEELEDSESDDEI